MLVRRLSPVHVDLLARGLAVFPLPAGDKIASPSWHHLVTTNPEVVSEWPAGANIGVACRASGIVGLDLDRKERVDGADTLRALCAAAGRPWPTTLTVATAHNGLHLYFRAPDNLVIPSSIARWPGIDVRAPGQRLGGYLVGPGSTVDNLPYTITHDRPIAPLPLWLTTHLTRGRRHTLLTPSPPAPHRRHEDRRHGETRTPALSRGATSCCYLSVRRPTVSVVAKLLSTEWFEQRREAIEAACAHLAEAAGVAPDTSYAELLAWLGDVLAGDGGSPPTAADILAGLTLADAARYHIMAVESQLLTTMVERGVPFQRVADALGTTRQGAELRYTRRLADVAALYNYSPARRNIAGRVPRNPAGRPRTRTTPNTGPDTATGAGP